MLIYAQRCSSYSKVNTHTHNLGYNIQILLLYEFIILLFCYPYKAHKCCSWAERKLLMLSLMLHKVTFRL